MAYFATEAFTWDIVEHAESVRIYGFPESFSTLAVCGEDVVVNATSLKGLPNENVPACDIFAGTTMPYSDGTLLGNETFLEIKLIRPRLVGKY